MGKKETEDPGRKGKETPPATETTQQQEKPQYAPSPEHSPAPQQQSEMQGYQGANQMPQPPQQPVQAQGYQGANQMPQPPQYQGQPVPYNYPPALPYTQGRPFLQKTNDNDKQEEPQTDEQQHRNLPNFSYSPYPPPYPQPQVQPYGYPGTNQTPPRPQYQSSPNAPGYPPLLPYSHVVYVQSPNQQSGPYRSREERKPTRESTPGYAGFTDVEVRRVFVRKVYLILMIQLLFTLGMVALFVFEPNTRWFVRKYYYIQYMALAVFAAVYIGLACSGSMRRKYPTNIILLSIFTVAAAVMMGTMSSYHRTNGVLIAIGICAAVCFAVTLFSFHTKFDFTTCGGILCVLLLILVLFGIIAIFVQEKVMTMIYAGLGSVVFMMYLAYDTQMLMGGKNVEISSEEYILAAIQLYIDVIYIFMFLLVLVGGAQD
ncbi:Protein lifeguard 1 [Araneus ventricosus]|uniref:Protein lifeguard 1 n=1 Tax=Araneus ventricosus TaxID=182803 RepID=A0A4Y2CYS3_ARAVE|nr:Protein lifeguard 1 [Araneus ventricosus]